GGCLQEETLTSPSAPAPSRGTPPPTPGLTLPTWSSPAITSEAQLPANPFTQSPATLPPELLPMTTSNTPRSHAGHHHQRLPLRQQRLLLPLPWLRLHQHQLLRLHRQQQQQRLLHQPRRR